MRETDIAVEFLRQWPPFDRLDEEVLHATARRLEASYHREGQRILDSEASPGVALIRKGAVRLVDREHRFLDRRSEGELFGHPAWFHGEQKPYVAEAEEDTLVWRLSPEHFEVFKNTVPGVREWFESRLASRVAEARASARAALKVAELLRRAPVTVSAETTIRDTAARMRDERVSSVLVMADGRLAGIVTDKDLRRRVIAAGMDTARAIGEVMTADPATLAPEASADAALLTMMRHGYHHLPVVNDGVPVGLVTAGDVLRSQSEHPLRLLQDISRQGDLEGLGRVARRLPSLFERMVALGRDVEQIGRMITLVTDAFTVRLVELAQAALGEAPMAWAWLGFGSQAREEQTARTDQDNGIVTEREPGGEEARWFEELSCFVCEGLDALGYVYCPGEIMALNPKWRVSLQRWKAHFDGWIDAPEPKAVMHSSIFFDMRCIHGDTGLVEALKAHAYGRGGENSVFLRFMAANALTHRPPIGFFRRFVQEDDGSHSEGLNLKNRGIVPLIDLARLRALEAGITEPNTFRRLELAAAAGALNEGDAASLRDALDLVGRLRLEHQARQLAAGEAPGNFVPIESLSPLMRRQLKAAFMLVQEAQNALALRYQVH